MKNALIELLSLFIALSLILAQPSGDPNQNQQTLDNLVTSVSQSGGICPQCFQSSIQVNASQFPLVKIHATYLNVTVISPPKAKPGETQISNDQLFTQTLPAKYANVTFYVNNLRAYDSAGQICNVLTDELGNAECEIIRIHPADSQNQIDIASLSSNAILTVRLHSSQDDSRIKPSSTSPILIRTNSQSSDLFTILAQQANSAEGIAACFPLMIVLGLLIASMQYMGKNPLSLFDITVPRLPAMKKSRMKPPTIPYQLMMKGRLSARIIARTERSTLSQILTLYKRSGKGYAGLASEIRGLFPYKGGALKVGAKSAKPEDYKKMLARLQELVAQSGASKTAQATALAVIMRNLQVREALTLDLATTSAARAGKFSKRVSNISSTLDFLGTRIAKPWKLVLGNNEKTDMLPGIPFVEKTALVLQNWVRSRYGNIAVRRALYKSIAAETTRTLGISKGSQFVQVNIYDSKKVGEIPRIVERMRQETYILGRAVIDEYMRSLALSISVNQKNVSKSNELEINKQGMRDVLSIIEKVRVEMDQKVRRGEITAQFRKYFENESIMSQFRNYIQKNNLPLYDALGNKLSDAEVKELLNRAVEYASRVRELIMQDSHATADGRYPSFSDEKSKNLNPEEVYNRYKQIVGMLDYSKTQLANGRIPMVMLGHDPAEIFGIAVGAKISNQQINVTSEAQRLAQIRFMFEAEFSKKLLFDYIMGTRSIASAKNPLGSDGYLNPTWYSKLSKEIDVNKVREMVNYTTRGEWAARNQMTAFYSTHNEFSHEDEMLKLNALRQQFSYQFDKGFMTLFRNSMTKIERNFMVYEGMKSMIEFYNGTKWTADSYDKWKQKGATYQDIRKGVWVIDANHVITPIASEYKFDSQGRAIGASTQAKDGRLTYTFSSVAGFMGSDYAERPINASFMFKDSQGRWRPGTPTDRETLDMINTLKGYYSQITGPKLGSSENRATSLSQKDVIVQIGLSDSQRAEVLKNISALQTRLDERMRLVTRESLAYDKDLPTHTRARKQIVNFLERAMRGGIHDTDARMQEWYASQSYARIALETYQNDFKKGHLISEEVKNSLDAKEALSASRKELSRLMTQSRISKEDRQMIDQLRNVDIPKNIQDVHTQESVAIQTQKTMGWPDRDVKRVADSFVPFYNVAEQTVMRDPRITYGSAYGLGPAMMSGYQTGQFVSERPQMWAGYALMPGDRIANILARPSYWATMAFGMHTRTFFTKMVGYTTIYHLDPEKGIATNTHEQNFIEAVQSIFKPWQSFDWFTRNMMKPQIRTKYVDEFGFSMNEEGGWPGSRKVMPLSLKAAGTDDPYQTDVNRAKLQGLTLADEMRRTKIGLTFREEFELWNKRYASFAKEESDQIVKNLREYLKTSSDPDERRMIKSQISEMGDIFKSRAALNTMFARDIFRQGYYSVENRSGYDISAIGGAHRPAEMVWAFHDTINKAPTPGMFYTDFEDRMQMFPFVTMTLANPLKNSNLATMTSRIGAERVWEKDTSRYLETSGVGRNVQAESIRDVYRRETPLFLEFAKVEQERQLFQFHNSPYIFPIAPLYVIGYHALVKPNVPRINNAAWSSSVAKNDYDFFFNSNRLSTEQQRQEQALSSAKSGAQSSHLQNYTCPTHGISLSIGQSCPICRSQQQVDLDKSHSKLATFAQKRYNTAKNWAISAASFGGTIPIGNYNQYFNQTHCPNHGIMHERGTPCPLCLQDRVRSGELSKENASMLNDRFKSLNREIGKIYTNLKISQDERAEQVEERIAQKRRLELEFKNFLNVDKRDTSYKHSREYIQSQIKKTGEYDNQYGYKIKFQ